MQKNAEIGMLLDCYQGLLTQKQADVLTLYYEEDLSLTEITEHYHITRQAVLDMVRRGEKQLYYYEDRLALLRRRQRNQQLLQQIEQLAAELPREQARQIVSLAGEME